MAMFCGLIVPWCAGVKLSFHWMEQLQLKAELATPYNLWIITSIAHLSLHRIQPQPPLATPCSWLHSSSTQKQIGGRGIPLLPKVRILSHYFDDSVHPPMRVGMGVGGGKDEHERWVDELNGRKRRGAMAVSTALQTIKIALLIHSVKRDS